MSKKKISINEKIVALRQGTMMSASQNRQERDTTATMIGIIIFFVLFLLVLGSLV